MEQTSSSDIRMPMPLQSDFSTLDLGFANTHSEFQMPSESKCEKRKGYTPKKLDSVMLNQCLEDQPQIDKICHIFGKKRKKESSDASQNLLESWHEVETGTLASVHAPQAELKPCFESQLVSQLSLCCTSMSSSVRTASSKVISVSFTASISVSLHADTANFSNRFDLSHISNITTNSLCSFGEEHLEKRKRVNTLESDADLATACSLPGHVCPKSAMRASKPHQAAPHPLAAARPPQRRNDVEEFSVGSGWPEQ